MTDQVTGQAVRFLGVGLLSVLVDTGVLVALRDGAELALWAATTLAFAVSLLVNFGLNLTWVFGARGLVGRRLGRYLVLVAVNYLLTLVLVLGLEAAGLWYVLAKWVAVAICAVLNFVAYRYWVFA